MYETRLAVLRIMCLVLDCCRVSPLTWTRGIGKMSIRPGQQWRQRSHAEQHGKHDSMIKQIRPTHLEPEAHVVRVRDLGLGDELGDGAEVVLALGHQPRQALLSGPSSVQRSGLGRRSSRERKKPTPRHAIHTHHFPSPPSWPPPANPARSGRWRARTRPRAPWPGPQAPSVRASPPPRPAPPRGARSRSAVVC